MILTMGNKYLFDTTVFIDAMRKRPVARQIIQESLINSIPAGYSIITEAELWSGIRGLRTVEEHIMLLRPFVRYNLNVTIARRAGEFQARLAASRPVTMPDIPDCIIAATAEYYDLVICSKNTRHYNMFSLFSIPVLEYSL